MKNVILTDPVHPYLKETLDSAGFIVDDRSGISLSDLYDSLPNYHGIVFNSRILINEELIAHGSQLEFVARLGSGLEIVDQSLCEQKGISVFSAPAGNALAVAEHALGMLLALSNKLISANREVKNFEWNRENHRGFEISGQTIGIIGFGNNGSQFARLLSGFEMEVLAYDIVPGKIDNKYARSTSLEDLKQKSDIISLHIPLTDQTNGMVNEKFLSQCVDGLVLVNTSRGQIVDTPALINELDLGHVAGVCLDVFQNEKPVTYTKQERKMYEKLFAFDQVIVSPHVAGWTKQSLFRIAKILTHKIIEKYTSLDI